MLFPNSCLEQITVPTRELRYRLLRGGWAGSRAHCHGARKKADRVPGRNWGVLEVPACYVSILERPPQECRRGTATYIKGIKAVPGPCRGAPQGDQGCPSCTWAHQGVNITYPTRPWPLYSPPHQVLSLGLQDLGRVITVGNLSGRSDPHIRLVQGSVLCRLRGKIPLQHPPRSKDETIATSVGIHDHPQIKT